MKGVFWLSFFIAISGTSCAYRHGSTARSSPGGHKAVQVPLFRNLSHEVGVETSFTNALMDQLIQSRVAYLSSEPEVKVLGTIESIQYSPAGINSVTPDGRFPGEPINLAAEYRVVVVMGVRVQRTKDDQILWASQVTGERNFLAAQILAPIVNSANPLYNLSARRRVLAELAQDMAAEATDKMTENF